MAFIYSIVVFISIPLSIWFFFICFFFFFSLSFLISMVLLFYAVKDLSYKEKHWHEACFLCNKCRISLVDKQFGSKAEKIYCGNCYDVAFASRCDGCGEVFRAGKFNIQYDSHQFLCVCVFFGRISSFFLIFYFPWHIFFGWSIWFSLVFDLVSIFIVTLFDRISWYFVMYEAWWNYVFFSMTFDHQIVYKSLAHRLSIDILGWIYSLFSLVTPLTLCLSLRLSFSTKVSKNIMQIDFF